MKIKHKWTRRDFLVGLAGVSFVGFAGCKEEFRRSDEVLNLGQLEDLLFERQHVTRASVILFRDDKGWSVQSSRCTYDGCDLTYDPSYSFCSCCKAHFSFAGDVLKGPATRPLPYYELFSDEGFLFVATGKQVDRNYRYTVPKFPELAREFEETRKKKMKSNVPPVLTGEGTKTGGKMFVESERYSYD